MMNKTKFLAWMVIGLLSVLLQAQTRAATLAASGEEAFVSDSNLEILSATIQIRIYPPDFNKVDGAQYYERGLGSLISHVGGTYIYTHDHWGLIDNPGKVQFYNYLGELLLEISGEAFKSLIYYRDGGTIFLLAPIDLRIENLDASASISKAGVRTSLRAAETGVQEDIEVGDVVVISRKRPSDSDLVDLLPATIESFEYHEGIPVLKLRSQNGETLFPGDSGGGVWLNGRLIGNMWMVEWVDDWRFWTWKSLKPAIKRVDTSIAALIPDGFESFILDDREQLQSREIRLTLSE